MNNAAIAAQMFRDQGAGRVAILDIDYHHGNGTQDIFFERSDVLTVSTHGDPRFSYPYFSGYDDERGQGAGLGFNLNIPLPEGIDGTKYRQALRRALARITAHRSPLAARSLTFRVGAATHLARRLSGPHRGPHGVPRSLRLSPIL